MPHAANGQISTDPIAGGIEITDAEYRRALDAKAVGDDVRVVDGVMEIYTPSRERTTYWIAPAAEHETEPGEDPPEGAVTVEPPDDFHIIENGQWVYSLERERDMMRANPYQVRAALSDAGLLVDVENMMEDETIPEKVRLMWRHKDGIRRNHPAVIDMAKKLGWTDTQLDDLFRAAMAEEA